MSRWEPNARERLDRAALELFVQQGYEATTVAEIAERAGLTKSTFFRHFSDKRELLFWGQDALIRLFGDAITGAPGPATPIEAVTAALDAVAEAFPPERRTLVRQRHLLVEGNSDLRERSLLKRAVLAEGMADALRRRGVPDPAASLAAELGILAFHYAHNRWVEPDDRSDFADLARQELAGLRAASAALG